MATYRVQLRAEFGFDDAAALADYLVDLGVSHVYCSPSLQAAPGSAHGYDVVDPTTVNGELGGAAGRARLRAALAEHHLGAVLDIVPNHMDISGPENRWWWDVLAHGRASRYATTFDVDWSPPGVESPAKIVLPVLGDDLDRVLGAGELSVDAGGDGGAVIRSYDNTFPVAAGSLDGLSDFSDPDTLRSVLDRQHYRLADWRSAADALSYRRFFDVTTLIGVRVEDPQVFADTHRLILGWLADGSLDGVRIDHVDGLRQPGAYLDRLRAEAGPDAWIVVEKILEGDERLVDTWPIQGTTGYEALAPVDGVFVDPAGEAPLTELWAEVVGVPGSPPTFADVVRAAKRQVMHDVLGAEVGRLTAQLMGAAARHEEVRSASRVDLHELLVAVLTEFPRYRAYVPEDAPAAASERAVIEEAAVAALARQPDLDPVLAGFVVDVLAGRWNGPDLTPEADACVRFQHLSGPVMAKSVEDTAFYRYHRLISRNEVGGDPAQFATPVARFHAANAERGERWPESLTALTTHDTKRSEDVRARIAVLAEVPSVWADFVGQWLHDGPVDRPTQYLLLQTMVGAWPLPADRAVAYMEKATREAKVHTSWLSPDESYDTAVAELVAHWSTDPAFQASLGGFVPTIVGAGRSNAVAQKVVQLTMPGVPDLYQGSELWDLSLVDPDNRRPVDYDLRRRTLADVALPVALAHDDVGRSKLAAVRAALGVRARQAPAFGPGSTYSPLTAAGPAAAHVLAFVRSAPQTASAATAVTVVTRLPLGLAAAGGWGDATLALPAGRWVDAISGAEHDATAGPVPLADLLGDLPAALLEPQFSTQ